MTKWLAAFEKITRLAQELEIKQPEAEQTSAEKQSHPFDERNIHPSISMVSQELFDNGHFSQATFEAFKYLDNFVKKLSIIDESGFKLMMAAFNEAKPKIKLTNLTTTTEIDEQSGYKHIFAGVMSAVRNPRGHEILIDPIDLCLDHLSIASVLLRRLDNRVL